MSRPQVRTSLPAGGGVRYLGELGPVSALRYSFPLPGGCAQLACSLGTEPTRRTDALDPGRLVDVIVGGSIVWQGILAEPVPDPLAGWQIQAIGGGNWGSMWR